MDINVSWTELKTFANDRSLCVQWIAANEMYSLLVTSNNITVSAQINITDPAGEDQNDFETNYKNNGNQIYPTSVGGKDTYTLATVPASSISIGDTNSLMVWDRNQPSGGGSASYSMALNDLAYPSSLSTKCNAIYFDISGTWTGELKAYMVEGAETVAVPMRVAGTGTCCNTVTGNGLYVVEGEDSATVYLKCTTLTAGSPLVYVVASTTNSGTYAHQAGTWNINNISGTVSLPTGAATSALQTQPGVDIGDVTINNSTGGSAVNIQDGGNTITVDGTVSSTQSGTWSVRTQDGSGNNISSTTNALDVNIKSGSIPAGSNLIGKISIDQTTPGTTNLVSAAQSGAWNVTNVSGAVSLPTGAATSALQTQPGVDIGDVTINNSTGAAAVNIQDGGNSITVDGTVTANQGGSPWAENITQFGGVSISTGTGSGGTGIPRVTVSSDSTVNGPTLTKATQGSTGFSVQDLKDAGRTTLSFYATNVAAGTTGTETAISLTKSAGTGATSSANSFVITNGKRFRITSISVATRGNSVATIQTTTFNLRLNTGGGLQLILLLLFYPLAAQPPQ